MRYVLSTFYSLSLLLDTPTTSYSFRLRRHRDFNYKAVDSQRIVNSYISWNYSVLTLTWFGQKYSHRYFSFNQFVLTFLFCYFELVSLSVFSFFFLSLFVPLLSFCFLSIWLLPFFLMPTKSNECGNILFFLFKTFFSHTVFYFFPSQFISLCLFLS